jgi:hypothetical protein
MQLTLVIRRKLVFSTCLQLVLLVWLITLVIALNEVPWNLHFSTSCTLYLIATSLTALPKYMNGSISMIVASHNIMSPLENTTFSTTKNLTPIILRHNEIHEWDARTFESVLNLHHLDTQNNRQLCKLDMRCNTLSGLHWYLRFSLSPNALELISYIRISYLESNQFRKHLNLQNLDLSSKTIERVDADMLKNNTPLEQTQFIRLQHFLSQSCS